MLSICGRGDNARGQCGGAAARFRQRRTLSDERHAKACGGIHAPPMRNAGRFIRPHLDWSGRRDLNPRQPAWKAGTLPLSHSRPLPSSIPHPPTQKVAAALPARFHIPSAVRRHGFNPNPPFAPLCAKIPPCPYARLCPSARFGSPPAFPFPTQPPHCAAPTPPNPAFQRARSKLCDAVSSAYKNPPFAPPCVKTRLNISKPAAPKPALALKSRRLPRHSQTNAPLCANAPSP